MISSTDDVRLFCPRFVSITFECFIVGDIGWTLFVIVKRFFFAEVAGVVVVVAVVDDDDDDVVAGDFDVDADRFVGRLFVFIDVLLLVVLVIVRFGDGGRIASSLICVDVRTVNDGADDNIAKDDNGDEFELLFIVKNDGDDVDVVVIVDETGLLIIKRGVGFVTIVFVFVVVDVVVGSGIEEGTIELVCEGNIGGVELPDDDKISDIELDRSFEKTKEKK